MSSFSVKGSLRMDGSKWLCHRSRHCLPFRPVDLSRCYLHGVCGRMYLVGFGVVRHGTRAGRSITLQTQIDIHYYILGHD